jgi:hypothetical protein
MGRTNAGANGRNTSADRDPLPELLKYASLELLQTDLSKNFGDDQLV